MTRRNRQTVTCPECGGRRLRFVDYRPEPDGSVTRIRRCSCGAEWNCVERVESPARKSYFDRIPENGNSGSSAT